MSAMRLLVIVALTGLAFVGTATPVAANDPCPSNCTPPEACTHIDGPLAREVCIPALCYGYKTPVACAVDQLP